MTKPSRSPNPTRIVDVTVQDRMRPPDEATVDALMESIKRIGLQTPISVRWRRCEDDTDDCLLVAGRHRLEACRRLGWESILAFEFEEETEARLWEISENLHRAELTPEQRDEHIREWVRLNAAKGGIGPTLPNAQPHDKGTSAVARQLGVDRKTVREAVVLGNLANDAKEAANAAKLTRKDKLEIAKVDPEQQVAKVSEFIDRKQQIVPGAGVVCVRPPEQPTRTALVSIQEPEEEAPDYITMNVQVTTPEDEPDLVVTTAKVLSLEEVLEADTDDEAERQHQDRLTLLGQEAGELRASAALAMKASIKVQPKPQDNAAIWLVNTLRPPQLDELLQHLDSSGHQKLARGIHNLRRASSEVSAVAA